MNELRLNPNPLFAALTAIAMSGCAVDEPTAETTEASLGGACCVQVQPQLILLSVDQVEPAPPVEQRPVYLHFTLQNATSVARTGFVQAVVARQDGSTFTSNAWNVQLAARASTQGILEFDAPYAGPAISYAVHYYDAAAPTVAMESNATQATFPVAIRAKFEWWYVQVARAADSIIGDRDTAYAEVFRNGTLVDSSSVGLGYMHNGTQSDVNFTSPPLDLVPGVNDVATFHARVGMWPNTIWAQASDVTMADQRISVSGDTMEALLPNGGDVYLGEWFCNGAPAQSCPTGAYYHPFLVVWRVPPRLYDVLPMLTYAAQIRANQQIKLSTDIGLSVQLDSNSGIVWSDPSGTYYAPPAQVSAPTIVRIVFSWYGDAPTPVYIEVLPA
jgi:hypothetical protein